MFRHLAIESVATSTGITYISADDAPVFEMPCQQRSPPESSVGKGTTPAGSQIRSETIGFSRYVEFDGEAHVAQRLRPVLLHITPARFRFVALPHGGCR